MNKLAILLLLSVFLGCKKDTVDSGTLNGTWELRHMTGVQIAGAPSVFEPGNGSTVTFEDDHFRRHEKGKLVVEDKFTVEKTDTEVDGHNYTQRLVFEGSTLKMYIKLEGRKLVLSTGSVAADGTTSTYRKL